MRSFGGCSKGSIHAVKHLGHHLVARILEDMTVHRKMAYEEQGVEVSKNDRHLLLVHGHGFRC